MNNNLKTIRLSFRYFNLTKSTISNNNTHPYTHLRRSHPTHFFKIYICYQLGCDLSKNTNALYTTLFLKTLQTPLP